MNNKTKENNVAEIPNEKQVIEIIQKKLAIVTTLFIGDVSAVAGVLPEIYTYII